MKDINGSKRTMILATLLTIFALGYAVNAIAGARCFQILGDITCRVETEQKVVALTFDDGPTRHGIDAVLPLLERYDAPSTFFLIGEEIEKNPGLAESILAAGHELGNHSYSHARNVGRSQKFYHDELVRTQTLLSKAGSDTQLFRPPYGKKLVGLPIEVERANYRTIMWDAEERIDSAQGPEAFAQDIMEQIRPGSIVLMHPMYSSNSVMRDALPIILRDLSAQGYRMVTVSQLLTLQGDGARNGRLSPGNVTPDAS